MTRTLLLAGLLLASPALQAEDLSVSPPDFITAASKTRVPPAGAAKAAADAPVEFSWDDLPRYTRRYARELDWSELFGGGERVVYVGEGHYVAAIKDELIAALPKLREAGITHVALEMFGREHQAALDRFAAAGEGGAELTAVLKREWGHVPESYVKLLGAMREQGLSPVAVDLPQDEEKAILASGRNKMGRLFEARDKAMTGNIARLLKEAPRARVLVLVGSDHIEVTDQPGQLEDKTGVKTRRVKFLIGGDFFEPAVDEAGLTYRKIFLPLPREVRGLDGVISIPDVRKEGNGTGMLRGTPPAD